MDALAFSGPDGARLLASALRTLSDQLEAGTVCLQSIETSSAIDVGECPLQHLGITYVLSELSPDDYPSASTKQLHS